MQAIIIAAGQGSRLWQTTEQLPKTLLPIGEGTILSSILGNLTKVGVDRCRIVIGVEGERIRSYIQGLASAHPPVVFYENREWLRGNGLSVLAAYGVGQDRQKVDQEGILLSMCDHLVSPSALRALTEGRSTASTLLVDRRPDQVFDLDDATKVLIEGRRILAIGKELREYNAVDCGVFRLQAPMFEALRSSIESGRESISEAVRELIRDGQFEGQEIPAGSSWIDIDTPEAYRHACAHAEEYA